MTPSRVIAITGASAGIGRATALRLARDGAALAICARRPDRLAAAAAEIEQAGGATLACTADVTDERAMLQFVADAVQRFGRLDAMVCNAGFGIYGTIDTIDPARMRRLLDVNVMGTYNAAYAALPVFRRQQRGHLIVVSSIVGQRGIPFMGAYSATKFAQVGLAESLRAELAGSGIHVSVVYPISTRTEFHEVMMRESGFATRASGPRQEAAQVADAIARALEHPRPEVYPFGASKGLAIINAVAPGLCDRLVKRWGRKPATADSV
ncbi:MAG: SDR family NAD(P)-dependent oxidoreductase [Vicinamibacterales bacterium]